MRPLYFLLLAIGLLCSGASAYAQTVSGTVSDEVGNTLVGANVIVQGTTIGAVSNADGEFSLDYNGDFPFTLLIVATLLVPSSIILVSLFFVVWSFGIFGEWKRHGAVNIELLDASEL